MSTPTWINTKQFRNRDNLPLEKILFYYSKGAVTEISKRSCSEIVVDCADFHFPGRQCANYDAVSAKSLVW